MNGVSISYDNKMLVTGSSDFTASIWNLTTVSIIKKLIGHNNTINGLDISRDNNFVMTASNDKTAIKWDTKTGQILNVFEGHTD